MRMPNDNSPRSTFLNSVIVVYVVMLLIYLVAAFFPAHRIWGLNLWAYFPIYVPVGLFFLGLSALAVFRLGTTGMAGTDRPSRGSQLSDRVCVAVSFGMTLLYSLAFCLMRPRTYFLGDGYANLATLTPEDPFIKLRAVGEVLVHIWVKDLIGQNETAALLSYQIISVATGILLLVALTFLARRLFDRALDRLLFLWMIASGGYMYNYFGYTENYALFVLTVTLFAVCGLLVARGELSHWVVLPLLALAVFFHVFGVSLIPPAAYLMTVNTRLGDRIGRLGTRTKAVPATILLLALLAVFFHHYFNDYYFRFSLVPLVSDRFTLEGYTLLSLSHLFDIGNLLLLLVPSLPIAVVVVFFLPIKQLLRRVEYRHLLVLILSTCGTAFIFDPKLGMPRDWDLFSFVGVPLAVAGAYMIVDNRSRLARYVAVSLISATIGFLVLIPRAVSQMQPDISIAWFNNYTSMDVTKSMYGRTLLKKYYLAQGDSLAAELFTREYLDTYPERMLNLKGVTLKREGNCEEAIPYFKRALSLNPVFAAAYTNLGMCYGDMQRHEQAIEVLEIAWGLNPYNSTISTKLGGAYFFCGRYEEAEKALLDAVALDSDLIDPLTGLAFVYEALGRKEAWLGYMTRLADHAEAPTRVFKELGDYYLEREDFEQAGRYYRRGIQRGLSSEYIQKLLQKHPQLAQ
ncbi:MAG: tetratricopeptide repeat protein [candidate division Zixibacteria bacterium]|nr:tetratricopeptide repeat protein [candidate division Zixibacteria bacterium]